MLSWQKNKIPEDTIVILTTYREYWFRRVRKCVGLVFLIGILCRCGYLLYKLPYDINVRPIERVYDVRDTSPSHYGVYVVNVFGKEYDVDFAHIDVRLDVGSDLEVFASVYGLFFDKIIVHPIPQVGTYTEYTEPVYEGDKLDKKYVRSYLKFADGHEIDKDYPIVTWYDGVVTDTVTIQVKFAEFDIGKIAIQPIHAKGLAVKYAEKLYEGEPADAAKLKWYLEYEDDTKRRIKNVKLLSELGRAKPEMRLDAEYLDVSYQATLKSIKVEKVSVDYDIETIYEGDILDVSKLSCVVQWADGHKKQVSDVSVADGRCFSDTAIVVSTDYGTGRFVPNVIGVSNVRVNDGNTYTEGDIPRTSGFTFTYEDGKTVDVALSDVQLGDNWNRGLSAGNNTLYFTYHGVTYKCSLFAKQVQVIASQPSEPIEIEDENDTSQDIEEIVIPDKEESSESKDSSDVQVPVVPE